MTSKRNPSSSVPLLIIDASAADASDDINKSSIPVDDSYGEMKGIPAGRPGRDEDMAQAILMLACNQYAYGQVSDSDALTHSPRIFIDFRISHRPLLSTVVIYSSIRERIVKAV